MTLRLSAVLLLLVGCAANQRVTASPPASSSCSVDPGQPALDVAGRADGLYGVEENRVGDAPVARFENMTWERSGVDAASGKRWIHLRLSDADAAALGRFTAGPAPRGIAVVVDGRLACRHKVKTALTSPELQVSCCDSRACDAWEAKLRAR